MKILVSLLVIAMALVVVVLGFGEFRWRAHTQEAVMMLVDAADTPPLDHFNAAELEDLPVPVARYFSTVLTDGQPRVRQVWLRQAGEFLVKPEQDGWRPFEATQDFATRPAGFVWDARIRIAPGVAVRVRDASLRGEGSMLGAVLGLFPVIRMEHTPDIAIGALQRYLAEACWFPTALLPSAGVVWAAMDDSAARATLTVGSTTATVNFHFRPDGLIERVFALRPRAVGDSAVLTPWEGRWTEWAERNGVLIPVAGEVAWLLPEGRQAYWRGRITEVRYDTARLTIR